VLHYLQEKFGEREVSIFYNGINGNLPNEYFVDEFFNDDNLAAAINHDSPNRTVSLSSGSGQLLYLNELTKSQLQGLENRKIIIQDSITGYRKTLQNLASSSLVDFRIPLHSFDDLVTKIKETDEEKTRLGKDNERLLERVNKSFANQGLLDE